MWGYRQWEQGEHHGRATAAPARCSSKDDLSRLAPWTATWSAREQECSETIIQSVEIKNDERWSLEPDGKGSKREVCVKEQWHAECVECTGADWSRDTLAA